MTSTRSMRPHFDQARARGVEMLAWRCKVGLDGIEIVAPVPIDRS